MGTQAIDLQGKRPCDALSRESIRAAFRAWDSVKELNVHPLAELAAVRVRQQAAGYSHTPSGRGLALRETLRSAIEALRPDDREPDLGEKRWRPYVILTQQFLHGRTPDCIAADLNISRRMFYIEQQRAMERVAEILCQWEEEAYIGETIPTDPPDSDPASAAKLEHDMPFMAPPRPPNMLVGRDVLLAELKRRLLENQDISLTALQGLPGVGKTTLAIELAHDPEVRSHFSDGVLWVGLGRQPDILALLGSWAAAVRMPAEGIARHTSLAERARAIHAAIGTRRMLLVIDDAWHIGDALAFKVGGPNCVHLITTRLASVAMDFAGERTMTVRELGAAEGLSLLAQLAPRAVEGEREKAMALVQAVGGLPLALILMGGHLRRQSQGDQPRRLRQALAQLQEAETRLRLAQPQSPLEQQPSLSSNTPLSLQASIGLSDAALDALARRALRDLSLLLPKPNTFSEAAALAVANVQVSVLDTLVDHGLLDSAGADRYTLHQTISDYARLKGADSEASQRLVSFFVDYMTKHADDYNTLDRELSNLLVALNTAYDGRMYAAFVQGIDALHPFLLTRGLYAVAELHLSRAMNLMPEENNIERYTLLFAHEKVCDVLGKREAQRQDLDALKKLAEILNDSWRCAEITLRQANYYRIISDYQAAVAAAHAAIDLAEASRDIDLQATSYLQLGLGLMNLGDLAAARVQFERSLVLVCEAMRLGASEPRLRLKADGLRDLGAVAFCRGDYAEAQAFLEQSRQISHEIGDRWSASLTLNHLGIVSSEQGDLAGALAYFEQSLCISREIGDRRYEGIVLGNLGNVYMRLRDASHASERYEQALDIYREVGDRWGESMTLNNIGSCVSRDLGDYARAQANYSQSLHIKCEIGDRLGECIVLANLSWLSHQVEDDETARKYGQQAVSIAIDIGARQQQGEALTFLGHALAGLRQWAEAAAAYQKARTLQYELGQRHLAIEPLAGLARISLARGDLAQAQTQAEEILSCLGINTLDSVNEPFRVCLTCYYVLHASQDPRAQDILTTAYNLLQEQAAKISDEALRRSFLENVAAHRELLAIWKKGVLISAANE